MLKLLVGPWCTFIVSLTDKVHDRHHPRMPPGATKIKITHRLFKCHPSLILFRIKLSLTPEFISQSINFIFSVWFIKMSPRQSQPESVTLSAFFVFFTFSIFNCKVQFSSDLNSIRFRCPHKTNICLNTKQIRIKISLVSCISNGDIKLLRLKATPSHLVRRHETHKLIFFHFELTHCAAYSIFIFFRTYSQYKQSVTNKIIIIAFGGTHGGRKMMMTQAFES